MTAIGWTGALVLLAFTGVAQIPAVAEGSRWSVAALRAQDPVCLVVAGGSVLMLAVGVVSLGVAAGKQACLLVRARRERARFTAVLTSSRSCGGSRR
ncbi:hypothetical protein JHN59_02180 [Streptomyces sp. MBT49]|uniref:hypothetical protein n=1 Tax=Streptomyces sp. MBT49 TaxID=1488380 RepID=UPI00190BE7ED|nr:hypothetical protein [Streptomyces sp. MBT49]MBK3623666.1 hypothetical protein [Streptomyces sp. MBT49]